MHTMFVPAIFDHMVPKMPHPQHPISRKQGLKHIVRNIYLESPWGLYFCDLNFENFQQFFGFMKQL